ncbi:hypothetical protein BaRGS_00034738 [Batillaria attramentaria]|uniref:Uncharacterized protein n=1 Tax=Batillaria attramentaria TaxID=370345 RepID=A0ABD0JGQ1_9CAEN
MTALAREQGNDLGIIGCAVHNISRGSTDDSLSVDFTLYFSKPVNKQNLEDALTQGQSTNSNGDVVLSNGMVVKGNTFTVTETRNVRSDDPPVAVNGTY